MCSPSVISRASLSGDMATPLPGALQPAGPWGRFCVEGKLVIQSRRPSGAVCFLGSTTCFIWTNTSDKPTHYLNSGFRFSHDLSKTSVKNPHGAGQARSTRRQ